MAWQIRQILSENTCKSCHHWAGKCIGGAQYTYELPLMGHFPTPKLHNLLCPRSIMSSAIRHVNRTVLPQIASVLMSIGRPAIFNHVCSSRSRRVVRIPSTRNIVSHLHQSISLTISTHLLPESLKPLLLGLAIDPRPNHERNEIEERHPGVLGQELLRKGQSNRASDPGDFHHGHEARLDRGTDLVESTCASDEGHRGEVDHILNGCDLGRIVSTGSVEIKTQQQGQRTIKLLKMICKILAFRLVRPENSF